MGSNMESTQDRTKRIEAHLRMLTMLPVDSPTPADLLAQDCEWLLGRLQVAEGLAAMLEQYGRLNEGIERVEEEISDPTLSWPILARLIHAMNQDRIKALDAWREASN